MSLQASDRATADASRLLVCSPYSPFWHAQKHLRVSSPFLTPGVSPGVGRAPACISDRSPAHCRAPLFNHSSLLHFRRIPSRGSVLQQLETETHPMLPIIPQFASWWAITPTGPSSASSDYGLTPAGELGTFGGRPPTLRRARRWRSRCSSRPRKQVGGWDAGFGG